MLKASKLCFAFRSSNVVCEFEAAKLEKIAITIIEPPIWTIDWAFSLRILAAIVLSLAVNILIIAYSFEKLRVKFYAKGNCVLLIVTRSMFNNK